MVDFLTDLYFGIPGHGTNIYNVQIISYHFVFSTGEKLVVAVEVGLRKVDARIFVGVGV